MHRDIKPSNLIIEAHGRMSVINSGRAAPHTDDDRAAHTMLTETDALVVTLAYIPPERFAAPASTALDVVSGVHALGLVMYELLTDTCAWELYEVSAFDVPRAVSSAPPRPPSALAPAAAGDLAAICLTAISCDTSRRYTSVDEFPDDIESAR